MKGRFTLIFIILIFSSPLIQANIAFTDQYKSTFKFAFVQSATADENRTNYVLQQISFNNSISFQDLHLELNYVLNVELRRSANQESELTIILKVENIKGDTRIRRIDVSKRLIPHICTFEYRLYNKQTGAIYEQALVSEYLHETNLKIKRIIPDNLKKDEIGLEFYGLAFYFSEQDVMDFKSYISVIEDYYASAQLADSLLFNASKWRPDDGRNLLWNYFKINEYNRIHSIIKNKKFKEPLNLRKNDPADLLTKLGDLSDKSRRLQTLLKEGAKGSKLYFPNVTLLAQQIVNCQRQYEGFLKGSDFNNGRFLDELTRVNYSNAWFSKIHSFFIKGLNKRQQSSVNEYFKRFVRTLQNTHQSVAEQLLQSKKFMKASIQVENAKQLNAQLNNTNDDELKMLQGRIIYGLYHSYLSVAHRALSVPNIELARFYLDKALAYQKLNDRFIPREDAVNQTYHQLLNELIAKATRLKMSEQFPEATSILIEAITISKEINAYELEQKIRVELHDIYKLESYLIMKLNDSRMMSDETNIEEEVQNELVRLKGSQQIILNQLQRLNFE